MASAFSHAVVAITLGSTYAVLHNSSGFDSLPKDAMEASAIFPIQHQPLQFWILSIGCSILPDLDIVSFVFGIPYGSMWGHRGITHSLPFAFVLGVAVVSLAFPGLGALSVAWWALVLYFFLITASHGLLDAITNGGHGIAFFAPFDSTRYFLPWRPVEVSPIGIRGFFTERGLDVLKSEILWIWIPSAAWMILFWLSRRAR
jgi:inner membrane protein